ncbi:viral (superfamily 1) RNA helicase [Ruminiclostridium hungatei]|uniref:Viral (Superfamily 1) RNA helicase n=1 Tax=Ruminiclostridium hungatei TaxID=48256 RepID=A0A1V4SG32_RUMHU|nr:AAA domain-containing protein [Ruminiclostridium hungatei]OPX42466.1 viral (superfamily 1) RNA helicase [Ruminiclostridium hungatei]
MESFNKTIEYFIQYELMNRFNEIEIKEGKGIYLDKVLFANIAETQNKVNKAKAEKIKEFIKKISFKDKQYGKNILPKILEFLQYTNEKNNLVDNLRSIIDKKQYEFFNNYELDIYVLANIIMDNNLIVLYPILARGKKKIPLVIFECKIQDNKHVILNYKVQQEALRVIVASILKHGIRDITSAMGNEFYELSNSLASIQNPDIFETINIIDEDLKSKFASEEFEGIWSIKDYENWAVTEELAITLESLNELQEPIFREELEHLKDIVKDSGLPTLIQKYLFSNENSKHIDLINDNFHFGSYASGFSVNEKQWKVISSYNSNELTSVSGPPGTGKTTILKEIIADNLTRKIKDIVDNWDKPWEEFGYNNQKVYSSPFKGECNKSMILTSTNNDAVDNIGLELLREIEYFSEIAQNSLSPKYQNENLKGIFCARLGKKENMDIFNMGALKPLIEYLKNSDVYDEEATVTLLDSFKKNWEVISIAEAEIKEYLSNRRDTLEKLKQKNIVRDEITTELIEKINRDLQSEYVKICKHVSDIEESSSKCRAELVEINVALNDALTKIKQNGKENQSINVIIDTIKKYKKVPIIGNLIVKFSKIEKENGTQEELEEKLEDNKLELKHFITVKQNMIQEYEEKSKKIDEYKVELKSQNEECSYIEEKLTHIEKVQGIIDTYDYLKEKYHFSCSWDAKEYLFFNDIVFVNIRNELFILGLRINEAYIKKNKKEIIFNLEKVYPDKWFQPFYRRENKYDDTYTKCIKVMWETMFLCFPIVTTTLHSFDKSKFHMISGLFDTIMFDEAGQALLHTAVAPLYRARKCIIVGDVFQLEPIRGSEERLVERYKFDQNTEGCIDIERNSVQHGADRGADTYEVLNEQRVGIILDEHRRCENAIVQFSNRHVYERRLKIVKEDEDKVFLGKNLCFIDVRGSKNKNNENSSEAIICERVINSIIALYGEEYRSKIGIVTPFKNQVKLIEKYVHKIEVGTVHSFQGQEKEIIILCSAIDDSKKNNGVGFVGRKPNFLNVAFTRAKKQLIVIGNYEVYKNSNNYLTKAIETIEHYGLIYSIYRTELIAEKDIDKKHIEQFLNLFDVKKSSSEIYSELFKEYMTSGLLVEPKKHYNFLVNIIQKSNKSIYVVSPWITKSVVNDEMINIIKQKVIDDNKFLICFGYHKTNYTLEQVDKIVEKDNFGDNAGSMYAINKLKEVLKEDLKYIPPIHTKALIIDDEFMLIGSHNWLSNSGSRNNAKDEISCVVVNKEMIEYVKRRYF